jgi:hypothetical protein
MHRYARECTRRPGTFVAVCLVGRQKNLVTSWLIRGVILTGAFIALATTIGSGADVVTLRVPGYFYSEPATVRITVAVEPDARNRTLRLEADGERFYRSTEENLEGADEKRVHVIEFRNLPSGQYTVRAEVRSADSVRGTAAQELTVVGMDRN